jgi:KDO2-lipid IV(A) lauroyltransferase
MNQTQPETGARTLLETLAISGVGRACQTMSFDACRYAGGWLGLLMFAALGKRQNVAVGNIRLALGVSKPRARQLARRSAMNFGMTFAEFLHLPDATEAEIRERAYINGLENVWSALEPGRGAILLTAHLGNWELMGARAALEFPLSVVARPTSNGGVQQHIDQSRRAANISVISKYDSGRRSLEVLRRNETLGILPDQHAGQEGALLPFFGQPTRVWTALARLAMMSGAQVVPAFGVRHRPFLADGRIEARVSPSWSVPKSGDREAAILEGTKRVIWELEKVMRAEPDEWLWLHRRWRERDGAVFPK